MVRPPQDIQPLRGDLAQDAHRQSRARERVPADDLFGHAQLAPQISHLILEQLPNRFQQFKIHFLGQAAHVVV